MVPDCGKSECFGTEEDLDNALSYYFEGNDNKYKRLRNFPDYSETIGTVLAKFRGYYGSSYETQEYTEKALRKETTSYDRGNQDFTGFLGELIKESSVEGQERKALFPSI